jgi:hypothetical protein
MNYCEGVKLPFSRRKMECGQVATTKVRGHWYCECCADVAEGLHRMFDTIAAENAYRQEEEL